MPSKKKRTKLPPVDSDAGLTNLILQMLCGDQYWHDRIRHILAEAGIATRRIEREEAHPVWQAWLTRVSFDLDGDNRVAARQLRGVLARSGIKIKRDEFTITDRRGDKIRCAFMLELGAPGVWQPRPRRDTQEKLWPDPV
jgi:hypothetical protein